MSVSKNVKLKYPIPFVTESGSKIELNELDFTRIKAKNLKTLPKDFFDNTGDNGKIRINPVDLIPLIASLANISIATAEEIDFEDLANICEVIVPFLGESQKSGKN